MSPRLKKLVGLAVLLPGLGGYLLLVAVVADFVPSFWLAQLVFFLVAGLAWVAPAGLLLKWVNRDSSQNGA